MIGFEVEKKPQAFEGASREILGFVDNECHRSASFASQVEESIQSIEPSKSRGLGDGHSQILQRSFQELVESEGRIVQVRGFYLAFQLAQHGVQEGRLSGPDLTGHHGQTSAFHQAQLQARKGFLVCLAQE